MEKLHPLNFSFRQQPCAMRTCNDGGGCMDWDVIRNALGDARRAAGRESVEDFAIELGVDKTTIYRVEQHQTQPKLELVERWLLVTSGESVGAFFTRLESGARPGYPTVTRLMHNAPSSLGGVDASARAGLSDIQLLQRIAIAILHMVGAPELPRTDRPADRDEPPQG